MLDWNTSSGFEKCIITLNFEDDEVVSFEDFTLKISQGKIEKHIQFGYEKAKESLNLEQIE